MIEPMMYIGLGFLAASLLTLVIVPFVHARAVRLTMRRLEAATPLSMAEIQADKDQLRAEFAMSTRRLEISVEQLKTKTTSQLAELGKKGDTINRLKIELGEKTAAIFALEARDKAFKDQLHATEEELSTKTGALRETERALADKEAELARIMPELDERSLIADSQRVEIVALQTQVDALKGQVGGLQKDIRDTSERLARERVDAEAAAQELAEERGQVDKLGQRVAHLERQLAGQTAEAAWAAERVENALLRERINDVAAEVARLTSVLEGPDSSIEAILDEAARAQGNGAAADARSARVGSAEDSKSSLADRIRALQARASRVPSTT